MVSNAEAEGEAQGQFCLLLALPLDLQANVLRELAFRDRLAMRATGQTLSEMLGRSEMWVELAPTMWHSVQRHTDSLASDADVVQHSSATVVPACLTGASLIDVCARMVTWPACLLRKCLLATTVNDAAIFAAGSSSAQGASRSTSTAPA